MSEMTQSEEKELYSFLKFIKKENFEISDLEKYFKEVIAYDVSFMDIFQLVARKFELVKKEESFQLPCLSFSDLLMAPVKGFHSIDTFGPKNLQDTYTVEQFYTAMLKYMVYNMRVTNSKWFFDAVEQPAEA